MRKRPARRREVIDRFCWCRSCWWRSSAGGVAGGGELTVSNRGSVELLIDAPACDSACAKTISDSHDGLMSGFRAPRGKSRRAARGALSAG